MEPEFNKRLSGSTAGTAHLVLNYQFTISIERTPLLLLLMYVLLPPHASWAPLPHLQAHDPKRASAFRE